MEYFKDAVSLVTGGASGIGRALCGELSRQGSAVILADIDIASAERIAAELRNSGRKAQALFLDVRDLAAFRDTADMIVRQYGKIDFLFNVAGIGLNAEIRDTTPEMWKEILDIDLSGVYYGISSIYPIMIRQKSGHIINICSAWGLTPFPLMSAYSAAKHGVFALSSILAIEASEYGIHVTTVCPGNIDTPHHDRLLYIGYDKARIRAKGSRPMDAAKCARIILDGVARRKRTIVLQASLKTAWLAYRLMPRLYLRLLSGPIYTMIKRTRTNREPQDNDSQGRG